MCLLSERSQPGQWNEPMKVSFSSYYNYSYFTKKQAKAIKAHRTRLEKVGIRVHRYGQGIGSEILEKKWQPIQRILPRKSCIIYSSDSYSKARDRNGWRYMTANVCRLGKTDRAKKCNRTAQRNVSIFPTTCVDQQKILNKDAFPAPGRTTDCIGNTDLV
jgi:hypothetical protein